jgi:hypothetical protein
MPGFSSASALLRSARGMPSRFDTIGSARTAGRALVNSGIGYDGEPSVITKALFSAAIAAGVAVGVATPASADPSLFQVLSCSCGEAVTVPGGGPDVDQTNLGIQTGLTYLPGNPGGG